MTIHQPLLEAVDRFITPRLVSQPELRARQEKHLREVLSRDTSEAIRSLAQAQLYPNCSTSDIQTALGFVQSALAAARLLNPDDEREDDENLNAQEQERIAARERTEP